MVRRPPAPQLAGHVSSYYGFRERTDGPLQRREDFQFLTGRGRYVDDINLPGTLHLAILRSPHAHAIITGLDLSAAKAAKELKSKKHRIYIWNLGPMDLA